MAAHFEWLAATATSTSYVRPNACIDGCGPECREEDQHDMSATQGGVILAADQVVVIEGTPAQLRALAQKILAVVPAVT